MHDSNASGWRETIDRHHAAMLEELGPQVAAEVTAGVAHAVSAERERASAEMARAVSEEREHAEREMAQAIAEERTSSADAARRKLSESLNQTLRRIRQTTAEHEPLQLVLEDTTSFAERAVVVLIENSQARIAAWRGASLTEEDQDNGAIDLAEGAALKSCVETRDRLVVIASPLEVSPMFARALSNTESDRIYLFPISTRQTVVAVLLASGAVTPAPIELLCEAAGMKLESLDAAVVPEKPSAPSQEGLVQIAGASASGKASKWEGLGAGDQAAHLRAQRTAKVRVAQMRISESDALRRGVQTHDIYGALRISIDTARDDYRDTYMSTPGMVDYLHLEIVRSLAREDTRLLGQGYPGPISLI
jgi:hypothetical protein